MYWCPRLAGVSLTRRLGVGGGLRARVNNRQFGGNFGVSLAVNPISQVERHAAEGEYGRRGPRYEA